MIRDEIYDFLEEMFNDCFNEIDLDYTEEELEEWSKAHALEYFIEYLDFERQNYN